MTDEWEIFNFDGWPVRAQVRGDLIWYIAKDLGDALNIGTLTKSLASIDEADLSTTQVRSGGQRRQMTIINEYGANDLILNSRKPNARKMRKWITHEVIPSIRRTGGYNLQPQLPQTYAQALRELATKVDELEGVKEELVEAQEEITAMAKSVAAFEQLINDTDRFSVTTAAQYLNNLDGVNMGLHRLFTYLREEGWVKPKVKGVDPRPYQDALNKDWLALQPRPAHQRKASLHSSTPQILVLGKGLKELARRLVNPYGNVRSITSGEPFSGIELMERFQ